MDEKHEQNDNLKGDNIMNDDPNIQDPNIDNVKKTGSSQTVEGNPQAENNLDFLLDIPLEITIELDRTTMLINELLKLGQGSVIELSKFAGETLDVLANQRLIAKGEVVVINDKYGIRLTEIISPMERIMRLK